MRSIKLKPAHYILLFVISFGLLYLLLGRFATNVFMQTVKPADYSALNIPSWLSFGFAWDSGWYSSIALNGYPKTIAPVYAFFPLFPLLVGFITKFGVHFMTAGFLINIVASFLASLALYKLAREFLSENLSLYTVLLFLVFPMSFFLFAFYTEAVFCALSFWAIYFARKQSWAYASILAMLCTATRLVGLIVMIPIILEYLRVKQYSVNKFDYNILWFALMPLGLVSYMIYAHSIVGSYFAMFEAYKLGEWSYQSFQPNFILTLIRSAIQVGKTGEFLVLLPLLCWFGFATVIFVLRKKLPLSYIVYSVVSLIFIVLNDNVTSVNRYVLPLFPVFIGIVMLLKNKQLLLTFLIAIFMLCQGVFFVMFANGHWIG